MKKYGYINNLGELKLIQNNMKDSSEKFIGITKSGMFYIYTGSETKKLTKEEVGSYLNLTPEQVISIIKTRGKINFNSSKDGDEGVTPPSVIPDIKKSEINSQVRAEIKETQMGKEMTHAKASVVDSGKVDSEFIADGSTSLDVSKLKSLSLKNQVKYIRNRITWVEENYVTKEQMVEIIKTILQEKEK